MSHAWKTKLMSVLAAATVAAFGAGGLVAVAPAASASVQITLYASPAATATSGCTLSAPCSLDGAQAVVRSLTATMTGDIVVDLRGGVYRRSTTWSFSDAAHDSGTSGHRVIYQAYPGEAPEISGAQQITGWTLNDSAKNIWSASVGTSLHTRELYVDGVRAQIARGPSNPSGWSPTSTGLTAPDSSMASWPDVVGAEVVSENTWVHKSCPITAASGTAITLAQPCYKNAELPYNFASGAVVNQYPYNVSWVQNAYELLSSPGQFYLKSSTGTLYYIPRPGENLASADIEAPIVQTLVSGSGTGTSPLSNLTFSGLTFEHATWLVPSTSEGYAEGQAGWRITGSGLTQVPMSDLTRTPGNITFDHDSNLIFSGDTFTHLATVGLELGRGSKNDTVIGSRFTDIGGNAVQIGSVDTPDRTAATSDQVSGNTVTDNAITFAGQVYRSAVGVFVGYTTGTTISHNAIGQLPYTAISVNLGWEGTSYSGGATVTYNEIFQDMRVLDDGGALYTQMPMSSPSVMKYNWLHDEDYTGGAPLYLDSTAGNWTVQYNVLQTGSEASRNIQGCCGVPAKNNTVQFNYSNGSGTLHGTPDPSNTVNSNYDNLTGFPADARTIMAGAGLEPAYARLLTGRTVNDNARSLSYSGPGWGYSNNRGYGDFDDDVHYSYSAGATVQFSFYGSGVSWLAQRSDKTGPVEVYVDGVDEGTVTPVTSAAPYPTQQVDYRISGLVPAWHTLKIVNNGDSLVTIDAFTAESGWSVSNDSATAVTYAGSGWSYSFGRGYGDYGDDVHYSYSAGASAKFSFTGSGVSWLAQRSDQTGPVEIYVDGVDEGTVTPVTTAAPFRSQQVDYGISGLVPGTHTLQVVNNTASLLTIDAFVVEADRQVTNDTGLKVSHTGSGWAYSSSRGYGDYADDVHYTSTSGSAVSFAFTGTSVSWLAQRNSNSGPVEIYVDGVDEGALTPRTSGSPYPVRQVNYQITGLAAGYHTVKIVNSSAALLVVDAFTSRY
ncbi:MAG: hypothetical protein JWQ95_3238 [Sphaerisporangium sp.]|nr:hypothetical protein [Sphaerisporangium sp.]